MWLASLGMGSLADPLAGRSERLVTRVPTFMAALEAARHAMIAFNSGLIALIVVLTSRLLGWGPALVGGALLAFEPFLVAHGQVVHLDAPVSGLMTVALLAGVTRWLAGGSLGFVALAGVASGLAFVTKSPSAYLVLAMPVIALIGVRPWHGRAALAGWFRDLLVWGAAAALAAVIAWPALATGPVDTISRMVRFTLAEGGQPHGPGNFFLGQPVAVPGPAFYPVALIARLTPLTLAGLLALLLVSWWQPRFGVPARRVLLLIGLAVGFTLFMSLGAKKLDRYILPAVPLLGILAGWGLWTAALNMMHVMARWRPTWQGAPMAVLLAALLVQPLSWSGSLPYPLAYYNPLLGGGPAAERLILVGWGEGLDLAANYLNALPDADTANVAVYFPLTVNFQALLRGTAISYTSNARPTYVVDYINARQRGQVPVTIRGRDPAHVVIINGIEYARVYRVAQ